MCERTRLINDGIQRTFVGTKLKLSKPAFVAANVCRFVTTNGCSWLTTLLWQQLTAGDP